PLVSTIAPRNVNVFSPRPLTSASASRTRPSVKFVCFVAVISTDGLSSLYFMSLSGAPFRLTLESSFGGSTGSGGGGGPPRDFTKTAVATPIPITATPTRTPVLQFTRPPPPDSADGRQRP